MPTPPPMPAPNPQGSQPTQQPQATPTIPVGPPVAFQPQPVVAPQPPVQPAAVTGADDTFSWMADEYVHQEKGSMWLASFVAIVVVLAAIAWFVVGSVTFLVVVLAMGVSLGVLAFRPPRTLHYSLNQQGLQINDKQYSFTDFRSFGVVHDGSRFSITMVPTKRLMPAINIFFEEQQGEKIVDILSAYLPMQEIQESLIDKLLLRLRF